MNTNEQVVRLLTDIKESLQREFQSLEKKIDQRFNELNTRFDTQAGRLERQGALIQTGSRWTSRMTDWSETVDKALEKKDQQITDLIRRIERLETALANKTEPNQ